MSTEPHRPDVSELAVEQAHSMLTEPPRPHMFFLKLFIKRRNL